MHGRTNIIKNLKWAIIEISKINKIYIILMSISVIIIGVCSPVLTLVTQGIINGIQQKVDTRIIVMYIILYISIELLSVLYDMFWQHYKTKFQMSFSVQINERILRKAATLKLENYENSDIYNMINMAQYEGGGKILSYIDTFWGMMTNILTLLSYIAIIAIFKFEIIVLIIFIPIIKYLISKSINLQRFELIKGRTNDNRKSKYYQYLITSGNAYKELMAYNLFDFFINKYKSYTNKFNLDTLKIEKRNNLLMGITSICETIVDGGLFLFVIDAGYKGEILIGSVMTYMKSIAQIKSQITTILLKLSDISKESLFIDQLHLYFQLPEYNLGEICIEEINTIKVCNLSYRYRQNDIYVLKNINLEIQKENTVALVGRNGSGKSTLIKILMGFYDDYEGDVYINGINMKYINKKSLQSKVAILFQDFVKYESTFRENISYGNLKYIEDDQKLYNVIKMFGLENIVQQEEKKLDCQIGNWFDNGKQISIGQWQKIALSRAFLKNASLYILDEPNSALDPISELALWEEYKKIVKYKTGIIVVHKFSNYIKDIDKIVILKNGEIVGQGTHELLLELNDEYKKLYDIQTGLI